MEDLLTYSKYERVLCIEFGEEEQLVIQKSSSRALEEEPLDVIRSPHIPGDDDALQGKSFQSLLKEYLDACSKEQHQQTDEERHSVLMVQQYAGQLRRDMMRIETAMLDECQFLFCLPLGWACDSHMQGLLRTLFIQTGWMTQDDPKNRLIFSPFVESLIAYETIDLLARENKYLLLSMDNTAIHLSSFQMQSAKELVAVSRKLAASDFLLVPTDLGNAVTMDISDLDRLVYDSVKETVVRRILNRIQRKRYYKKGSFKFKNGNKKTTQRQRNNINAVTQPLFSTTSLHRTLKSIVYSLYEVFVEDKDKGLHTVLYSLEECKANLQGMTCGAFMDELLAHAKVKGFVDRVVCTVKEQYSRYSNLQNSPDGIQGIVLHCRSVTNMFHREIIRIALLDANLIDAQNEFIHERNICFGAMQKPFKMVQIANALLPPMVWNQRNNSNQAEPMGYTSSQQDDLLPPNSFYVQAYINDDCIRFILNKVVAVSCLNGAIQKSTFTIHEMSVKLECIFDSVCNNMWNHLVAKFEYQGEPKVHDHCDTHLTGDYSAVNYHVFQRSIHEMTENLLQGKGAKCTLDIDVHHTIAISDECNCSFQISYRALIDKGLQPVISHMATIVASSLASNSFFGLYTVSALIIMDEFQNLMIHDHDNTFKKAMERRLEAHHRRPIVFYDKDAVMVCESLGNWCTGVQQIFGHASYSQVSSTDYLLRFGSSRTVGVDENFGMYKYHSNAFIQGDSIERPNDFAILKKGHALDPSGSTVHAFYQKDCSLCFMNLDLCVLKRHKDKVYAHSIGRCIFRYVDMSHPFTIRVTPRHHESTIEFEVSHVKDYGGTYPVFESFSIQERLALK